MEKKILQELKNITKQLKNISNNTKTKVESELVYDQEDAINYIRKNLREDHEAETTEGLLRAILELEEDYMRSVGIIED